MLCAMTIGAFGFKKLLFVPPYSYLSLWKQSRRTPKEILLESAWLTDESCIDMISRNYDKWMEANLHELEQMFTHWKENSFAKVKKKKRELLARLIGIQRCMHDTRRNVHLIWLEYKLQKELSHING